MTAANYLAIYTIRRFEERLVDLKREGLIQGSLHLCCGQEAVPVGACRALEPDDKLTVTYRGHGWALARGIPPDELFAELMGRDSGLCGGRGGSAYFSSPDHGFLGENSIVAAGLPLATGAALAARFARRGAVSLVSIGDGAMNQGAAHEALNLAGVMRLPLVVVVENNGWAELTPASAMVATGTLAERAAVYGMHGLRVDGNDADAVEAAVGDAVSRARTGGEPTLIEAMTTRLLGHYDLDPQHYRTAADIEQARQADPLVRLRAALDPEQVATVERAAEELLASALDSAMKRPLPDPALARDHVYA